MDQHTPDDRVNQVISGIRGRDLTKPSTEDVAPVALRGADARDAGAALVNDEVRRDAVLGEQRRERVNVQLLVVVRVRGLRWVFRAAEEVVV